MTQEQGVHYDGLFTIESRRLAPPDGNVLRVSKDNLELDLVPGSGFIFLVPMVVVCEVSFGLVFRVREKYTIIFAEERILDVFS